MPRIAEQNEDRGGVLAIHLGDNAGYCYARRPDVWVLPKHSNNGYIGAAMFDALDDFWRLSRPDKIVLSSSLDDVEHPDVASLIVGLSMVIQVFGCRMDIPVDLVHPSNVHQALFERSDMSKRALKAAVTSLAKRRGITVTDSDAANALVLYEFATLIRAAA